MTNLDPHAPVARERSRDPLGEFLTAYDQYLDGERDYDSLPETIYPVAASPGRTTPACRPRQRRSPGGGR